MIININNINNSFWYCISTIILNTYICIDWFIILFLPTTSKRLRPYMSSVPVLPCTHILLYADTQCVVSDIKISFFTRHSRKRVTISKVLKYFSKIPIIIILLLNYVKRHHSRWPLNHMPCWNIRVIAISTTPHVQLRELCR